MPAARAAFNPCVWYNLLCTLREHCHTTNTSSTMITHLESDVVARPLANPASSQILTAEIEFGTINRNGECVNVGICRLQPNVNASRPSHRRCPQALAELSVNNQGCLQIFFPKNGMMPCTERAFFSHWLFPVPLAVVLPEFIGQGLAGLKQSILPAGTYPIRRSAEGYRIEF